MEIMCTAFFHLTDLGDFINPEIFPARTQYFAYKTLF